MKIAIFLLILWTECFEFGESLKTYKNRRMSWNLSRVTRVEMPHENALHTLHIIVIQKKIINLVTSFCNRLQFSPECSEINW